MKTWRRFKALARPFFVSEIRLKAFTLLGVLVALSLTVNWVNAQMSYAAGYYMTALTERREQDFYRYLLLYALGFVVATPVAVFYRYSEEQLARLWRRWLTQRFITRYLDKFNYYRINAEKRIDNPDQRIADEVRNFTATSLSFLLILVNSCISLYLFVRILWGISAPLTFTLLAYAVFGSGMTVLIGRKLISLDFQQMKKEADFRYGLIHVRDNAESIAFYRGEEKEGVFVRQRLRDTLRNLNFIIGWHRNLGFFTIVYNYASAILPVLIVAPLYLRGEIEFGVVVQAGIAFGYVLGALSLIVVQFERLSSFAACVARLGELNEDLESRAVSSDDRLPYLVIEPGSNLKLERLTVYTANRSRLLLHDFSFSLEEGQSLLVTGPNGSGKSTLLKIIAGILDSGEGRVQCPAVPEAIFLPQRPYMLAGSLRTQLRYSVGDERKLSDQELIKVLEDVKLSDLVERVGGLDTEIDWTYVVSLDEQQKIGFARMLLARPRLALLDEATSAIDAEGETYLYEQLRRLTKTYVTVSPRQNLIGFHTHLLEFLNAGEWRLKQIS